MKSRPTAIVVECSKDERVWVRHAAKLRGMSLPEYVKQAINTSLRREGVDGLGSTEGREQRLIFQALAIETILREAGIGPCSLGEGVRKLLNQRDAAIEKLNGDYVRRAQAILTPIDPFNVPREALVWRCHALKQALREYGKHKPGCASGWRASTGSSEIGPCDCGLDAALKDTP